MMKSLFKLIKKYKVTFLGDDHNMNQGRSWLADQIKKGELKIDFLALEYIETSRQDLLEKKNQNTIKKYLKKTYWEFPGLDPDSIWQIINSCQKSKVKIFGIEMPEESFGDWENEATQSERTKYIASKIIELTKFGKGIVLIGADHAEKRKGNVFDMVKQILGTGNVVSLIMIGGKNWSIDTKDYWIRKLELEAKKQKKDKELYFFIANNDLFPTDWVIHFPQVEKQLGLS